jgi:predicted acylesterase/phospholipase RssA
MAAKPRTAAEPRESVGLKQCDLVMAGGITSGVVFPPAIAAMAKDYRFKSVGGASAGAIAAAGAAAAEFGRQSGHAGSFKLLADAQGDLARNLAALFQPAPDVAALMGFARDMLNAAPGLAGGSWSLRAAAGLIGRIVYLGAKHFPAFCGISALAFLALSLPFYIASFSSFVFSALGVVGTFLIAVAAVLTLLLFILAAIVIAVVFYLNRLKAHDFGLCPGPKQAGSAADGLMDWVAELIERAAGRIAPDAKPQAGHAPLTFSDLEAAPCDVTLRMMTSNLSLGVGYALPSLGMKAYFFKKSEIAKVLPAWAAESMSADAPRALDAKSDAPLSHEGEDLFEFPTGGKMPVIAAVRMSLCFPVLFTAFPLYRQEFGKRDENAAAVKEDPVRRVLFSDGGITSNFPSRFFDKLVPSRPTFGISLEDLQEGASAKIEAGPGDGRVYLPFDARKGGQFEIKEIASLAKFLGAVVNTAREWQDRKQARLPGWRERIARIYVAKDEGGLNLDMPPDLVMKLGSYGARAGGLLCGTAATAPPADDANFIFADHQWRRFLIAYGQTETLLGELNEAWSHGVRQEILATSANPGSFKDVSQSARAKMISRMDALAELGGVWKSQPVGAKLPKVAGRLQIVPHDDQSEMIPASGGAKPQPA